MENLADLLQSSGAVKFGDFTLTSGRKSSFYVDVKKASTKPAILALISKMMSEHIGEEKLLAGMELGAVPIVVGLALESGIPYVILRKGKREHGTGKQIEGEYQAGQEVLIVEDVATTGGSIVKSADILREAGLTVSRSLVVVDREEGATEALTEVGIELIPLVRMSQIRRN
jgi:orotate phosphoribosyltransferase